MWLGAANCKEELNMSNVKSAYKKLGKNSFYDGMITSTTFLGSLVNRIVWRMNKDENKQYLEKALSPIPQDFNGNLLEVPVGTGVLTMMSRAQHRVDETHIRRKTFRRVCERNSRA